MLARTSLTITLLLTLTTYSANQSVFAQPPGNQSAIKFDEFGGVIGDLNHSDLTARLDNYAIQLQNQTNAKAFVIVYRGYRDLPGAGNRLALGIRYYLVNSRGIDPTRVVALDGGILSCSMAELWIVPVGATPTPKGDARLEPLDSDSAYKFDEYDDPSGDDSSGYEEDVAARLEGFATALRKRPHSRGYIIAYARYEVARGYTDYINGVGRKHFKEVYADPAGTARKLAMSEKNNLIKAYHLPSSRIVVVDGGYRKWQQIELWIVPRGEHAPIATPNAFPKERAKRRPVRRR
ncbi:MAG: hypothetical protein ABR577_01590 [Pyrinomonadaceae bacterium]